MEDKELPHIVSLSAEILFDLITPDEGLTDGNVVTIIR